MKSDRLLQSGIVVLLALFAFVVYGSLREIVVNVGDPAPDFSITTTDGKHINPKQFGGKLLLLNFWATWCPPCVEETPSLVELSRQLGPRGLVVLGVSVDKNDAAYKRFLQRFQIPFSTYRDPDQKINESYGTMQYPESYLIDTSGKVVGKFPAAENWMSDQLVQHVQSLL